MATQENNNNSLYFVVGALVVMVAVLGYFFIADENAPDIDPAAGVEQAAENIEETTSEFKVDIEEDGVSASTSQSE